MKKVIAVIVLGCCFILFLIFRFSSTERPALQAMCNIMNKTYFAYYSDYIDQNDFTDNPKYFEKEIPNEYKFYGIITYSVDSYNHEKDLSTNCDYYLNKEVYLDKANDAHIYLKYAENKYLKFYYGKIE